MDFLRSHIFARGYKLICPTWQATYFALVADIPLNPSGKSKVNSRHPVPHRGASTVVTNVGTGCGGRGSVGRARYSQGGSPRERSSRADERRLNALARNFGRQHMSPVGAPRKGSCGRQNRVVLAPVAGVKLVEIVGPDRASIDR